jgi:hypothetical protein
VDLPLMPKAPFGRPIHSYYSGKFGETTADVYVIFTLFVLDLCSFRKVHKILLFNRRYLRGN